MSGAEMKGKDFEKSITGFTHARTGPQRLMASQMLEKQYQRQKNIEKNMVESQKYCGGIRNCFDGKTDLEEDELR